jgi:chloramphenicol-sensitive protein RarD
LVLVRRRFGQVRALLADPRRRWPLIVGSVLITINWGGYIWSVNNDRIIEASLGYFITPLFTVLLGVLLLKERLRPVQWVAVAIAFLAVAGMTIENGRPPWVALVLTFSFGFYGLAKKKANAAAIEGMAIESTAVAPLALVAVVVLGLHGSSTVTDHGPGYFILVLLTGPLTAIPLLLFGAAATRISMTTLGLLNYLTPVIQFILGTVVFHEHMSPIRWAGFALVWLALAIFTTDSLTHHRRTRTTDAGAGSSVASSPPPNYLAPASLVPLPSKDERHPK